MLLQGCERSASFIPEGRISPILFFFFSLKLSSLSSVPVHRGHWQHGTVACSVLRLQFAVLAAQIPLNRNFKWKLSRFWVDVHHMKACDVTWHREWPWEEASVCLRLSMLAPTMGHCRNGSEICPQEHWYPHPHHCPNHQHKGLLRQCQCQINLGLCLQSFWKRLNSAQNLPT